MKYPAKWGASYLPNDGAKEQMVNDAYVGNTWLYGLHIVTCSMFFFSSYAVHESSESMHYDNRTCRYMNTQKIPKG